MDILQIILIIFASLTAGMINALAGGGTLITFPTLIAMGFPPIPSNVTNTVALLPGHIGATFAQRNQLYGQRSKLLYLLPASAFGGLIGGLLLLNTGEKLFRALVPFLILVASGLLAVQEPVRKWVQTRIVSQSAKPSEAWAALPVAAAGIYGGYFGAGLSVIVLAVLGLASDESLTRLNAIKQLIAFAANLTAAAVFVFTGRVLWATALVMAIGALLGGALGGKLANWVHPTTLRWLVVSFGFIIGIIYLLRS